MADGLHLVSNHNDSHITGIKYFEKWRPAAKFEQIIIYRHFIGKKLSW